MKMTGNIDMVISADLLTREVAEAERLRAAWTARLGILQVTGHGRLRIDGVWETTERSESRIQELIHIHTRTVELLSAFRVDEPSSE